MKKLRMFLLLMVTFLAISQPLFAKLDPNPVLKSNLEEYLKSDPTKDLKKPQFIVAEDKLVDDVFEAETLRDFYINLYTINQVYLTYMKDPAKAELFKRLNYKLQKKAMKQEKRRNEVRLAITIAATAAGGAGAWYGINRLTRFMSTQEETKFWFKVFQWGGKKFFTALGIAAGGTLGYYAGAFGSALILGDDRFYLDPFEAEEDFGSILEDFVEEDELNGDLLKQRLQRLKALRARSDD